MHDPSVVVSIVCTPLWCAYLTGEFLCARCA